MTALTLILVGLAAAVGAWFFWRRRSRGPVRRPGAVRGRIYDSPEGGRRSGPAPSRGAMKATISARVKRAGSDEWENLGVIDSDARVNKEN